MSLKDDFLEALRSVKRDFFKDYEYTEATPQSAAPPPSAPAPPPTAGQPVMATPPAPSAMSDEEIGTLIRESAAAFDDRIPEVHSAPVPPSPADVPPNQPATPAPPAAPTPPPPPPPELELASDDLEDDEDSFAPDVDPTPFRSADGSAVSEFLAGSTYHPSGSGSGGGVPPSDGGRVVFDDFDSGDSFTDERTIISKNTVIRGALQTDDSVRLFGQILGDIDCKSNILVAGKVRGNTSAANAYVINAQVDGNLLCDDVINVTDDAWILGNIRAQQADIDGKIKGNIEIRHAISVGSNSSIIGNISTDELEIKRGAFVNGQIMMYSPSRDVIDRFDRFDQ